MNLNQYMIGATSNMKTACMIAYTDEVVEKFLKGELPIPTATHYVSLVLNVPQDKLDDIPDYNVPDADAPFKMPLVEACVIAIQGEDKDEYELLEYLNTLEKKVDIDVTIDLVAGLKSSKIDKENFKNIIELKS